jgi:sulfur carrier protein ThiS
MNKKEIIKNLEKTTEQVENLKSLRKEEDISMAITLMKRNGELRDNLTDMQKEQVDPLKASIKEITDSFKPYLNQAEENEETVKEALKQTAITLMNKIDEAKHNETSTASLEIKLAQIPFRQDKTLVIKNQDAIPEKYWSIDEKKLRQDLMAGVEVSGAELQPTITIVNK